MIIFGDYLFDVTHATVWKKIANVYKLIWLIDTCATHVPCCTSGSLIPAIPGACATCNFTYLVRGPWDGSVKTKQKSIDNILIISYIWVQNSCGSLFSRISQTRSDISSRLWEIKVTINVLYACKLLLDTTQWKWNKNIFILPNSIMKLLYHVHQYLEGDKYFLCNDHIFLCPYLTLSSYTQCREHTT